MKTSTYRKESTARMAHRWNEDEGVVSRVFFDGNLWNVVSNQRNRTAAEIIAADDRRIRRAGAAA